VDDACLAVIARVATLQKLRVGWCWRITDADLQALAPEERARAGIFLAFQYPLEIPGVNNVYLLKAALNAKRKHLGQPEVDAFEFLQLVKSKMQRMQMDEAFLSRGVNEGFSGGEKKRHEIVQLDLLKPKMAVLDETDSGLDVDALRVVSEGVNRVKEETGLGVLLITHYTRILRYIKPDFVHVFVNGRIAEEGGPALADRLEAEGYDRFTETTDA
jgi:Fe-S cluster assembly ATP-binding protein